MEHFSHPCEDDPHIEAAMRILPAWFVPRMMTDEWSFGLLLITGQILCLTHINSVHRAGDGSVWLDVEMMRAGDVWVPKNGFVAPTSRTWASVNAAHVIAAFELADT